jgi:hypothetical protein
VRINPVQLEQLDPIETEKARAPLCLGAKALGPAVHAPAIRARPRHASLGGHYQIVGIWVKSLGDKALGDSGSVDIGRVDQGDTTLDRPAKNADCLVMVEWLTPNARPWQLHRPVSEAANDAAVAKSKRAAKGRAIRWH